ncbi:glycosyltransferase family 4 protein [Bacteroidales bacterium OttesenSCG-928-J19]|nr:glycosyltransferase family 4 protein [Bacteroidales bacterium OttesenSCG-928-J19]
MKKIIVSVINDLVTDQRVHKVCSSLQQAGYDVTLVGRKFRTSPPVDREYKTIRMRLFFNRSAIFYAEYNIRLFILLLFKKTDLLLSNDTDTLPANYLISVLKRKPLLFDAHEMFREMPEVLGRKAQKVWIKIEDQIFPRLKYSYTVCQSIADEYENLYGMKMGVVRNIPRAERRNKGKVPIKKDHRKVILYQGAVNVGRGIEWVIEAMPFLDNFVFYVVGDGDILNELKEKVDNKGLNDRIFFTGRIPFEELSAYTACADIGVNLLENRGLNYYYSLPNRIFDFMRSNIPVLASDFPEVRRIFQDYQIGVLTDNYEPQSLADKIRQLAEQGIDEEEFARANADLTWENETKTLLSIVRQAEGKP